MGIEIQNSLECFVALWRELERTRQRFELEYKRFCIRRILKTWLGAEATDDFIWEVCFNTVVEDEEGESDQAYGYDILPPAATYPLVNREFLRAFVATKLGIGMRKVDLKALDSAYSIVFPSSTAIDLYKKKKEKTAKRGRKKKPQF